MPACLFRLPSDASQAAEILEQFAPVLESEQIEKIGHDLKFDLSVLKWRGISVRGSLFDSMIAHSLIEPEMRHGLDYLSEAYLGYSLGKRAVEAAEEQLSLGDVAAEKIAERAMEARCGAATAGRAGTAAQGKRTGTRLLRN